VRGGEALRRKVMMACGHVMGRYVKACYQGGNNNPRVVVLVMIMRDDHEVGRL